MFETTTTASQKLNIPPGTLIGLERRGVVGPFQRDASGRRLLTESDLAAVRAYLDSRDYRRLAELHRPTDPAALRQEVTRLASQGLTERDIGAALKLDPTAVRQLLTREAA